MLPVGRGACVAIATGDGAFRAPPGAGPRRVKAMEVPGAAWFAAPYGGAPMRRGPPAPGVHRAGTFVLFRLPGGARGVSPPILQIQRQRRRQKDPLLGEVSEEEVVLEEVGKVLRASRRLHLKGVTGIEASSPSAGIGASAQRPAVK
jgi:hypothetical protein